MLIALFGLITFVLLASICRIFYGIPSELVYRQLTVITWKLAHDLIPEDERLVAINYVKGALPKCWPYKTNAIVMPCIETDMDNGKVREVIIYNTRVSEHLETRRVMPNDTFRTVRMTPQVLFDVEGNPTFL